MRNGTGTGTGTGTGRRCPSLPGARAMVGPWLPRPAPAGRAAGKHAPCDTTQLARLGALNNARAMPMHLSTNSRHLSASSAETEPLVTVCIIRQIIRFVYTNIIATFTHPFYICSSSSLSDNARRISNTHSADRSPHETRTPTTGTGTKVRCWIHTMRLCELLQL